MRPLRSWCTVLLLAAALVSTAPGQTVTSFVFQGGGFGHGIGMSQYGALGMARAGHAYAQILRYYYTGVDVGPFPLPSTIRVGLRQADGGFRLSGTGGFDFSTTLGGAAVATGNAGEWWDVQREGTSVFLVAPAERVAQGEPARRGPYAEIWQRTAPGARLQFVEYTASGWKITGEYAHGSINALANVAGTSTHVVLDGFTLEEYVYGVAEVPSSWPPAAKEAQAVAARTYAGRRASITQRRADCSCAVVDDTRDQAYAGWAKETPAWTSAVDATRGVAVSYQGALANTMYHSSSGGYTEDNEKVTGGGALPYLRAVPDPFDHQPENSRWRWTISMTADDVSNRINAYLTARGRPSVGSVQSLVFPPPRGHAGRLIVITGDGGGVTVLGSAGIARLSGEQFRSALGLPSTLVFPSINEPTVDVSGGHVVDAFGGLHLFGGAAPASGGAYFDRPIVRDALARPDGRGGYVLDGWGSLVSVNGAPSLGPTPRFPSDLARSFALAPSGTGAYLLDGFGGIHRVGAAPDLPGGSYWQGWDIARAIAVTADGLGGYVLDGFGGLHPLGSSLPAAAPYFGFDIARDLVLRADGRSGYVLDGWGGIHAFGGAPAAGTGAYHGGSDTAAALALRSAGAGGYVLERSGILVPAGGAPPLATTGYFESGAARGFLLPPDPQGHVLAGTGQVAPFGLAQAPAGAPSFSFDIARDLALRPEGTGYVLDGFGGLHPVGTNARSATGGTYFPGSDRVRRIAMTADGLYGYTLDADGSLYSFDGAPPITETSVWWADGSDVARDARLRSAGGGYLLDEAGMVHAFGGAPAVAAGPPPWYAPGGNRFRAFGFRADEVSGYVLEVDGRLHAFGGAPALESGVRISEARDLILRPDGRSGWIVATGGIYPFGGAPPVSGGLPAGTAARAGVGR